MALTAQRLERLVAYRARLERTQELELAKAAALHAEKLRAVDERVQAREALFAAGLPRGGDVDPAELAAASAYVRRLEREIAARRAAAAHAERGVEVQRGVLLERRRDRRAMEILLERRRAEQALAGRRRETAHIDELAVTRWVRPAAPAEGSAPW